MLFDLFYYYIRWWYSYVNEAKNVNNYSKYSVIGSLHIVALIYGAICYCNRIFISIPSIPLYTLVLWLYTLLFSKVQLVVYYECCRTLVIESQYLRLREWKVPRKAKRSYIKHWKKINETKGVHGDSWKPPQSPLKPFKPPKQLSSLENHSFENT